MSAHTPGPWRVVATAYKGHASAAFYIFGSGKDGRSPAVAHIKQSTLQPMRANALLISAAPELLEIARDIHNSGLDLPADYRRRLRKLIAKVGGAS